MTAELVKRINLDYLYPPFLEKLLATLRECEELGSTYVVLEGYRTYAQQDKLYRQGRSDPGPVITKARGGQSSHNFGLAIDVCRDLDPEKPGLQPTWNKAHYYDIKRAAEWRGLHHGADYDDWPHVSWPGFVDAKDLVPLDRIFRRTKGEELDKLKAVWKYLDAKAQE